MSIENSTSSIAIVSTKPVVRQPYWPGLIKRMSITLATLTVIHIAARIAAGITATKYGQSFSDGFALTDISGTLEVGETLLVLLHLHITGVILIALVVAPPVALYIFVRWLFKI